MNGTKHDTEAAGISGLQIADFRLQIGRPNEFFVWYSISNLQSSICNPAVR